LTARPWWMAGRLTAAASQKRKNAACCSIGARSDMRARRYHLPPSLPPASAGQPVKVPPCLALDATWLKSFPRAIYAIPARSSARSGGWMLVVMATTRAAILKGTWHLGFLKKLNELRDSLASTREIFYVSVALRSIARPHLHRAIPAFSPGSSSPPITPYP
jgi:hypothetical protein